MSKGFAGITELADADYAEELQFPVWLSKPKFYDDAHDFVLAEACQGLEQFLQISSIKKVERSAKNICRYTITANVLIRYAKGTKANSVLGTWEYEIFPDTKKMFTYARFGADRHLKCIYIPGNGGDRDCPYDQVRMNRRIGELAWWICTHTNFYFGSYIHNVQSERHLFQQGSTASSPQISQDSPQVQQQQASSVPASPSKQPKSHKWQIAALIVIALLGASYFSSSQKNSSSSSQKKPAVTQQAKAPSTPASSSKKSSEPAPAPKQEKKKIEPLARSGVVTGYNPTEPVLNDSGLCEITIDNSKNDMPVYVRIWDADAMMPVRSFYIRQGGQFTADNLDPGTYQVRYIDLYEDGTASRGSKSENFELEQIETYNGTQYSQLSLTLYKVRNGNTQTTSIDADDI